MTVELTPIQRYLLGRHSPTYASYYGGSVRYTLHGVGWQEYVTRAFGSLASVKTSENIFKTVIDLYAENLTPTPAVFSGFSDTLIPLLCRGEAPVMLSREGVLHFPEHYELISDGHYTMAALMTRSLEKMKDYIIFIDSNGISQLWSKDVPADLGHTSLTGYRFVEELQGNHLYRLSTGDKGMGATLAALQDRINHSIIDQTIIAEMYARPFWYLLNTSLPVQNPYLSVEAPPPLTEHKATGNAGRVFTTSSPGPFGQLMPPTISDMVQYHESILDKVCQVTGIPQYLFKPGQGTPPTGVALRVLSRRFTNRIARLREAIEPELYAICRDMGLSEEISSLWPEGDDLLQDSLDAHGLALSQMGYPLGYVSTVVTPGVSLGEYTDDLE